MNESSMRRLLALAALAGLSACGGAIPAPQTTSAPAQTVRIVDTRGLEAVMGRDAAALTRLLGPPRLDTREGDARKLQFANGSCVLDAYLYPEGRGEPVVTYMDARTPDGRTADRASCVAALIAR